MSSSALTPPLNPKPEHLGTCQGTGHVQAPGTSNSTHRNKPPRGLQLAPPLSPGSGKGLALQPAAALPLSPRPGGHSCVQLPTRRLHVHVQWASSTRISKLDTPPPSCSSLSAQLSKRQLDPSGFSEQTPGASLSPLSPSTPHPPSIHSSSQLCFWHASRRTEIFMVTWQDVLDRVQNNPGEEGRSKADPQAGVGWA